MKYSTLLSLALVGSAEAFRTQATKKQPRKLEECNNAPDIFTDDYTTFGATYKVNSYRGNPNCQDLGFAYGYKMDERCFDATDHPFGTEDSSIKYAKTQGDCASGTTPSGTFTTKCIDDGGEYKSVEYTATTDSYVIMKGGNGGAVYTLTAGTTYYLDVGQSKGISHIEFCYVCDECGSEPETPETAAPTVECEYDWVVDHDVATSPAEVGIHVEMFPYAEKAHFNITLDDPQYGGKTFTDGWCIDWDRLIGTQDWDVDIFSFASDAIPAAALDKHDMLPNLAWLINNIAIGDTVDEVVQGEQCTGTVNWLEIQGGIWGLVDNINGTGTDYETYRHECVARWVRDRAIAEGNGYTLDCSDPNEQIPLVMVIDEGEVITNQTIISEMNVHTVPGLCNCAAPTTAPTKAPTTPSNERSGPTTGYNKPTPGSGSGDPHFKTWTGDKFDYHGECDLVLVDNPKFNDNQGLKIHIRTTRVKYFSYISKIAVQIGTDVLEFENDVETFLINGLPVEHNRKHHKTHLGGFIVRRDSKAISIRLHDEGRHSHNVAKIDLHTRKNGFPAVIVDGGDTAIFEHSLGLLGDWKTGTKFARDGVTVLDHEDATLFAEEWQVRDTEPMLFSEARAPQFPAKCMAPKKHLGNRLGTESMRKQAEKACSHWKEDMEDCIFDVIATRDVLVAAEGHIVHLK